MKELKDGGEKNIFKGVSAYAVRERENFWSCAHTEAPISKVTQHKSPRKTPVSHVQQVGFSCDR